ncbi:MAG: acetyl-CoA carboxylase carboxyl transferase subunit alpha, partial [Parvibaculales bacterium]
IDRILTEPMGGAHRDRQKTISDVGLAVAEELAQMAGQSGQELRDARRQKFLNMGRSGLA